MYIFMHTRVGYAACCVLRLLAVCPRQESSCDVAEHGTVSAMGGKYVCMWPNGFMCDVAAQPEM
jgi:hypothetical protein